MESLKLALQDFVNKSLKKIFQRTFYGKLTKKTFVTFSRFWPLRGWGWGKESESFKKDLGRKSFSDNVE